MSQQQHDALAVLLNLAMGEGERHGVDVSQVDFERSMRANGFDSLLQVAMYSLYEELTGELPESSAMTLRAMIDRLCTATPELFQSTP